jgi:DNA-binding transcriptional LysR family regulator
MKEVTEPDLVARKVASAAWSLYAAPSYVERKGAPPCPEDLGGHEVITFDASLSGAPGALWLAAHACGTHVVLRANSIVAALNAAICGMGIAALPCIVAGAERAIVRVIPGTVGERDVFLAVHPDLARVARVRAVMDFFIDVFERDAVRWNGAGLEVTSP